MTDKYINKKWVDEKMKHDPFYLFENKRDKFDRWLKKRTGQVPDQDAPPKAQPEVKKAISAPAPAKPVPMAAMDDLINLNAQPEDSFSDFHEAKPQPNFDSVLNLFNPQQPQAP